MRRPESIIQRLREHLGERAAGLLGLPGAPRPVNFPEGAATLTPSCYLLSVRRPLDPPPETAGDNVVVPFPLGRARRDQRRPENAADSKTLIVAVLSALADTDYGQASFYWLRCHTRLAAATLRSCLLDLHDGGLVTLEERPDGSENLKAVTLNPFGRELLEEHRRAGGGAGP